MAGWRSHAWQIFERFAEEADWPVNRRSPAIRTQCAELLAKCARTIAGTCLSNRVVLYGIAGKKEKSAACDRVARYWLDYIRNAPIRRHLHRRRSQEIIKMKFDLRTSPLAS